MKVLLLEDVLLEQLRFQRTIEILDLKIDLTIANNGKEGILLLKNEKTIPDLILIDLNMPGQNGIEFLKELKTLPNLKNIRTIAFTTSNDPQDIDMCYENGVSSFIHKPMNPSLYKETVKLLITYWKMNIQ
ncbi:response regulator [Algoriphagus halophilus]|uniref:Response regulator receiver domain-containing protein n=1 Tax=Algoriphagus halophilus TaxID=226505 RepID=A0A1N6EA08_9BACT|nr:response regulator [Algoriphagus halophilus]SIN79860.1 Response regulator receiver domain-containing protein [Algoriphagus halophilus]